ncbi:hypothetical protein GPN2_10709 [Streptomyces murinus]
MTLSWSALSRQRPSGSLELPNRRAALPSPGTAACRRPVSLWGGLIKVRRRDISRRTGTPGPELPDRDPGGRTPRTGTTAGENGVVGTATGPGAGVGRARAAFGGIGPAADIRGFHPATFTSRRYLCRPWSTPSPPHKDRYRVVPRSSSPAPV